jgi:hypothetical protein
MSEENTAESGGSPGVGDVKTGKELVAELEMRVRIAELRAQELEAELRLLGLMEKRRDMKSGKQQQGKNKKSRRRRKKNKANGAKSSRQSAA